MDRTPTALQQAQDQEAEAQANAAAQTFIARWAASGGSERSNYQLFLTELCELLDVPRPDPASSDNRLNDYVFERAIEFDNGDGTRSTKFADLYRRGAFICETKQGVEKQEASAPVSTAQQAAKTKRRTGHGKRGTRAYNDTMVKAKGQAEQYARNLAPDQGRPPLLLVVDVGHSIELYSEFSQTGGAYVPFPDPQSHRIRLEQLADSAIRERLRLAWTDPLELDPARRTAKVTRDIAAKLAKLAKRLEAAKHDPEDVAHFLMRCLFTMFAEDVGLLPKDAFREMLESLQSPEHFRPTVENLWRDMNKGGFNVQLRTNLLQFNGGLFYEPTAIDVDRDQLDLLIEAAAADWQDVEPAIFGTLLERALSPAERHKLGAHYTPRAYVERLVMPTVVEPLREEWDAARAAAITLARDGDADKALEELQNFHDRLCEVRVLDPACGSGNFLYVVLEHLKRLEGEVFDAAEQIAERQMLLESGHTVDPHQLLGIEINPRAAAIAELVLWIGYLQWHFRTRGKVNPPQPVIKNFKNIECRDAVLAYDDRRLKIDPDTGKPITIWDGRTTKPHPVTGLEVPDETARQPLYEYVNPRKAEWPKADFVVGNPPFIGGWMIRQTNGDGYVEALWSVYDLPEKADYVMYWWDKAAKAARNSSIRRFGLITTNSIRQVFQRRVLERHMSPREHPLQIVFAIADHPWVDDTTAAAVRIAMTVGTLDPTAHCQIGEVVREVNGQDAVVDLRRVDEINHLLKIGVNLDAAKALTANDGLCSAGVQLYGAGFIVDEADAQALKADTTGEHKVIRKYLNGKDFMHVPRGVSVIDFFALDPNEARAANPKAYQRVLNHVKPERDQNRREAIRTKWWRFGWERPVWRNASAGLARFIATPETSKHRVFRFLDGETLPDNMLTAIATEDAELLGVLSSRIHVCWCLASGGTLESRPRYTKTRCFDPFPFPDPTESQKQRIRELGEQLDAHRKRQQAEHPKLTMTGMYNVLEKLRAGEELTAKEKTIHEQGLVSVLRQVHDDLDAAVAEAYGWPVDLTDEEILERLVALNHQRAEEEKRGIVRWLRPDFQNPEGQTQQTMLPEAEQKKPAKAVKAKIKKQPWPKTLSDQAAAVQSALATIAAPADETDVAKHFTRAKKDRIAELLETLESVGRARQLDDGRFVAV